MSFRDLFLEPVVSHRIVLVLQADHAHWFRWSAEHGPECFVEQLIRGDSEGASHCPWIEELAEEQTTEVHLVLDSSLDEVERIQLPEPTGAFLRYWQCLRLHRRLAADYPDSDLHRLSPQSAPDLLSVVHPQMPEEWGTWLRELQTRQLYFSHVSSAIELLCRQARGFRGGRGQTLLFDIAHRSHVRHLLVEHGKPLFLRLMPCEPGDSPWPHAAQTSDECERLDQNRGLLLQSINHALSRTLNERAVTPVLTVVSQPGHQTVEGGATRLLAESSLGRSVDLEWRQVDGDSATETAFTSAEVVSSVSSGSPPAGLLSRLMRWMHSLRGPCLHSHSRWRLKRSHLLAGNVLGHSLRHNRQQNRIRLLRRLTLLCACLAGVTLLAATVQGVSSARERARLGSEEQRLQVTLDELSQGVHRLSDRPVFLMRALERIDTHARVRPTGAETVLTTVASAMRELPDLVLDHLSWVAPREQGLDDAAYTSSRQVPVRNALWRAIRPAVPVRLEISGHVQGETGLRQQQAVVDQLAEQLRALPGVGEVHILLSPASASDSSERTASERSGYRLSLTLGDE